jgi:hypothetical protein
MVRLHLILFIHSISTAFGERELGNLRVNVKVHSLVRFPNTPDSAHWRHHSKVQTLQKERKNATVFAKAQL